jgi:DNA-binding MarR family transcriptional regulator
MQQMQPSTNGPVTSEDCAARLLEVAPMVMRTVRAQMRSQRDADLSVPQFRALGYVYRHPGTALADVAAHLGLTPPAASRLVDGLVQRQYVQRQLSATDRRSIELRMAPRGTVLYEATRRATQAHLAALLQPLPAGELTALAQALETLRQTFAPLDTRAPRAAERGALAGAQPAEAETADAAPPAAPSPTTHR